MMTKHFFQQTEQGETTTSSHCLGGSGSDPFPEAPVSTPGRRPSSPPPSRTWVGMSSRGSGGRSNGTLPQTKICQFKLVLLGDMAVGKSSLVLRFVKGQFDEFQETTIGGER